MSFVCIAEKRFGAMAREIGDVFMIKEDRDAWLCRVKGRLAKHQFCFPNQIIFFAIVFLFSKGDYFFFLVKLFLSETTVLSPPCPVSSPPLFH